MISIYRPAWATEKGGKGGARERGSDGLERREGREERGKKKEKRCCGDASMDEVLVQA